MNLKLIKKILLQLRDFDIKGACYTIRRRKYLSLGENCHRTSLYGNKYNGFRVFEDYLIDKKDIIVYSFGIGEDLSFSEEIMRKFEPQIYAYDPTPRAIEYVKHHSLSINKSFHFYPYGLSDKDETVVFHLPDRTSSECSGSAISFKHLNKDGINVQMKSLNTILEENGHKRIDLLKLDIEGSEFKVIQSLIGCNATIGQICLEIHDRFFDDGLLKLQDCLTTMRNLGFILIAISYSEQELTFINERFS